MSLQASLRRIRRARQSTRDMRPSLLACTLLTLGALGSAAGSSEMAELLHRPIRAAVYPANSNMGIFFALAVPLEDPANSVSVSYFFEASYGLPTNATLYADGGARRARRAIDRATVYDVLQSKFRSAGLPGHDCLLRSICEASEYPLDLDNGLLGDMLRVVFGPSTSRPEDRLPDGVFEAELAGRAAACDDYRGRCPLGLFDLVGVLL